MTTTSSNPREKIAVQFIDALPFAKALQLSVIDLGDAWASMAMAYSEKIIGDPETGVVHGGSVSALLDTCCGLAVSLHPESAGHTATIDLRIDYMRPARVGLDIRAEAKVFRVTRTVAFVRATAFDEDREDPVATATGAFTFVRRSRK